MADAPKLVNIAVDGKAVTAPAGTLLIEACKTVGIEVPSFCYYPNLSLQGACRMCLVKVEKMPKLQTACTTVVGGLLRPPTLHFVLPLRAGLWRGHGCIRARNREPRRGIDHCA